MEDIKPCWCWWFGTLFFFHILGISYSHLTFIFFRGVGQAPTRKPHDDWSIPTGHIESWGDVVYWDSWRYIHGYHGCWKHQNHGDQYPLVNIYIHSYWFNVPVEIVDLPKAIVSMAIEIVDLRYKMLDLSIVFWDCLPDLPGRVFFSKSWGFSKSFNGDRSIWIQHGFEVRLILFSNS